jgi:hypothetical protein
MDLELKGWRLIIDSQIDGDFEGFNDEQVFILMDGTYWYQRGYKYNYHYSYCPRAKIYQKGIEKIIVVDGLSDYAEVQETSAIRSTIINEFNGWSGDTIFELQNGQIWKQAKYQYKYFYAYRPKAVIIKVGAKNILNVKGRSIRVTRLK